MQKTIRRRKNGCISAKVEQLQGNDRKFQRNESCMQQHLYKHFYSEGHNGFLENVSISLIDETDRFQPKKRENYSMRTLKTLASLGINVENAL